LIRRNANSVEAIRELIAVPPEIEDALRLYASHHPEDAKGIEKVLRFRRRVREEFDRLVHERATHVSTGGDAEPHPLESAGPPA
jgi:hypothetical protein